MKKGITYTGRNIKKIKMWMVMGLPVEYRHARTMTIYKSIDSINQSDLPRYMRDWARPVQFNRDNPTYYRLKPQ